MKDIQIQKNKEYIVDIIDNGCEAEGIAKIDNFTIFIPEAIKGEKCKILIVKVCSTYAYGKILEIIEKSPYRNTEDCSTYKRCGGCNVRHINYQYTLEIKRNIVQNLMNKVLKNKVKVNDTIGMQEPYHYRNKLQYPIGRDKNGKVIMGVFAKRTHEIIPIDKCMIQNEKAEEIAKYIYELLIEYNIPIYDEKQLSGQIRHIVIKIGTKTNEIMCIIVTNENKIYEEKKIVYKIIERFPEVKTIIKNINNKNTNVILGNKNITLYGDGYIYDKIGEYTFKISPLSFYQTNAIQTEILYQKAIEFADLNKNDVICDLYCGIGTIGIYSSKYVKKVYGIEIVEETIDMAKENAKINQIKNIEFMAGDVEKILPQVLNNIKEKPNVVFVDPPRKGLNSKTINILLNLAPKKIIYISCNPATLARDLKEIEKKYEIKKIQPIDMFPYTSHVECCSVLYLKNSIQ